jgi:hypothetical protein
MLERSWHDQSHRTRFRRSIGSEWIVSAAVVVIRPVFVSRAVEEHWGADSKRVEIANRFLIRDPFI